MYVLYTYIIKHILYMRLTASVCRQKSAVAVALVVISLICIRQDRVRILARDPLHALGNGNSLGRVYRYKKGVLRKGHLTKLGFCKESNCSAGFGKVDCNMCFRDLRIEQLIIIKGHEERGTERIAINLV